MVYSSFSSLLALAFVTLFAHTASAIAVVDCIAFAVLFPRSVYQRNSPEYAATLGQYFSALEREVKPMCVVRPKDAQELGKVVKYLSTVSWKPQVAIKGGGHTTWAGAANIQDGIVIDMSGFTGVTVNSGTASIGVGEHWGSVYTQLQAQGLTVSGGRVAKVGVPGLVLGGGLSFFSDTRGFVADDVVNFDIVLSSGELTQANKNKNADLFKALKGGNNNFGIVTKIDLPAFQQGPLWGGGLIYDPSAWPAIVDNHYAWAINPDKFGHIIAVRYFSVGFEAALVNPYSTNPNQVDERIRNFTTIQPQFQSTIREDSIANLATEQGAGSVDGTRQIYQTTTFKMTKTMMLKAETLMRATAEELKTVPGFTLAMALQSLTKQLLTSSAAQGPNSLGLSPNDGPLIIVFLNSVHDNKADDSTVIAGVQKLIKNIENLAVSEGTSAKYRFLNYAYKGQPVFQGYGAASIASLKAASRKYDPKQFFQKNVPGAFKISDV